MDKRIVRTRKKMNDKLPILLVLIILFILIGTLIVSYALFMIKDFDKEKDTSSSVSMQTSSNVEKPASNNVSKVSSATSNVSSKVTSSKAETESIIYKPLPYVPMTEKVESTYFDDALFIGDSLSEGLKLYGVLPSDNVLANKNVSLNGIYNGKAVYNTPQGKQTLYNALNGKMKNPKKIYIMLGLNGMGSDNTAQADYYSKILDKLIEKYPDAIFYVQSVTPITKAFDGKLSFTNKKISELNELLVKMATDKKVFYLNVREAISDKSGALRSDFAAKDGTHLNKAGYQAIYEYYANHAM